MLSRHIYNQKSSPSSFATGTKLLNSSLPVRETVVRSFTAVTGWVPYFKDSEMPPSAFRTLVAGRTDEKGKVISHRVKQKTALYLLFLSGNRTDDPTTNPNPDTLDEAGFLELSECTNYRAMLALKNLKTSWNARGQPVSIDYDFLPIIGYTLIRFPFSSVVWGESLGRTETPVAAEVETMEEGPSLPYLDVQARWGERPV